MDEFHTGVGVGGGLLAVLVALITAMRVAWVAWHKRWGERDLKAIDADKEKAKLAADWPAQMLQRIATLENRDGEREKRMDAVEKEAAECATKYQVILVKYNDLQAVNLAQTATIEALQRDLKSEVQRGEALAKELHELHRAIGGPRLREIAAGLRRISGATPPQGNIYMTPGPIGLIDEQEPEDG
jgi:hypothetical protein